MIRLIEITFFVLAMFFLCVTAYGGTVVRSIDGVVVEVYEGDRIRIKTKEKKEIRIVFYGVDAPEMKIRDRRTGKIVSQGQPFGELSKKRLKSKLLGKKVTAKILKAFPSQGYMATVYMGKRNINLEVIKEGYAWANRRILKKEHLPTFVTAEDMARLKVKGLWKGKNPEPPWKFRKKIESQLRYNKKSNSKKKTMQLFRQD